MKLMIYDNYNENLFDSIFVELSLIYIKLTTMLNNIMPDKIINLIYFIRSIIYYSLYMNKED